jgi:energy-coupling factor transporter ATP-binding protein EcfA2
MAKARGEQNPIEQRRATTADDAFWTLDPLWLVRPEDPWYANLESHFEDAEYEFVSPLVKRLAPPAFAAPFRHVGVVGHRGAGKSTLVRKAMAVLEERHGFCAVYIDVEATLDRGDFTFADVLVTIVNAVAGALDEQKATVPASELELFRRYFAEELLTEKHAKTISGSIEGSAEAGITVPFFAKLMSKVTALVRSDNEYRQEIRRVVERDPRDMVARANHFLTAAAGALGKRLVVVFDNLEKVSNRGVVETAFLQRADEIRSLRTAVVLFLHPADEFAPQKVRASDAFDIVTLPMLPVRAQSDSYGHVSKHALAAARGLLDKRVDLDKVTHDSEACLKRIVQHSGGRLRDILELMRMACERAGSLKVTVDLIDKVARKAAGERGASLHPGDHERLIMVANTKQVPNDDPHGYLLLHSMILQYNGVPWWDIHPLLLLLDHIRSKVLAVKAG